MPYVCQGGDGADVIMHLQQLTDPYQSIDLCEQHWAEFVVATGLAMGLVYPDESTEYEPGKASGIDPGETGPQEAPEAPGPVEGHQGPDTALTDDQRPAQAEPAPY